MDTGRQWANRGISFELKPAKIQATSLENISYYYAPYDAEHTHYEYATARRRSLVKYYVIT